MNFLDAIKSAFDRFFDFETRSSRSEFWLFTLFKWAIIFLSAFAGIRLLGIGELLVYVAYVIFLIPTYSVGARRLHDKNLSGWLLLTLVPCEIMLWIGIPYANVPLFVLVIAVFVGFIIIWALPGNAGRNKYGDNPLGASHDYSAENTSK